jgi:hypothetical protein
MKPTRHTSRFTARLMMALVLFAQGFMATSGYAAPEAKPVGHQHHLMTCHEKQEPATSTCLTHCSQADQISLDHAAAHAVPAGVASWQVTMPPVQRFSLRIALQQAAPDTGPPIPIRFCSFLI